MNETRPTADARAFADEHSRGYREGYKIGYQKGAEDGRDQGYINAKVRAHVALQDAPVKWKRRLNAGVGKAEDGE